jgi:hypothetical protein
MQKQQLERNSAKARFVRVPPPLVVSRRCCRVARSGRITTELNQLLVVVELYNALGGGWEEKGVSQAATK